ncbi:MAG TPA: hypothetical protein VH500_10495 [Nitrososphaeraceae archaeon]|jgi:hypothetical protein
MYYKNPDVGTSTIENSEEYMLDGREVDPALSTYVPHVFCVTIIE